MTINELKDMIHENAVKHGFWDTERPVYETMALIHAKWSEALEEARAGRDPVWYRCTVDDCSCIRELCNAWDGASCDSGREKPEGIYVELIDAVIRIFDYLGSIDAYAETDMSLYDFYVNGVPDEISPFFIKTVPDIIDTVHNYISDASRAITEKDTIPPLLDAAASIMFWIADSGYGPEELLEEKHEYNKSRPYRHGKKL